MNEEYDDWSEEDMIRVKLKDPSYFKRVQETLTRIGIVNVSEKKLWQTCHILERGGEYYIIHFKEAFLLQNKDSDLSNDDIDRRNAIVNMLQTWDMIEAIDLVPVSECPRIFVLRYAEKKEWTLYQKVEL